MILHLSPLASTSLPSSAGGLRLFQSDLPLPDSGYIGLPVMVDKDSVHYITLIYPICKPFGIKGRDIRSHSSLYNHVFSCNISLIMKPYDKNGEMLIVTPRRTSNLHKIRIIRSIFTFYTGNNSASFMISFICFFVHFSHIRDLSNCITFVVHFHDYFPFTHLNSGFNSSFFNFLT